MIPHSRPRFDAAMQQAVGQLLASGQVTAGGEVARLEALLCQQLGRRCAVVVDSATSALMLALRMWNRDGDLQRVGIPAFACASLYHAVRGAGLQPVAMDCDADTLTLGNQALAQAEGLDAVILAHPLGWAEPLVAAEWPCPWIEDVAQSVGASWQGRPLGGFGRISVASFHATKPWGGAYGGALLLDDDVEAVELRRMIDSDGMVCAGSYVGHHQLSDLHALLARLRIEQAAELQQRRGQQFARLSEWLAAAGATVLAGQAGNHFRLLMCTEQPASLLVEAFRAHGVAAALPIQQPLSRLTGDVATGAEAAFARWLSLPLLTDGDATENRRLHDAIRVVLT
ncbi:MAG: DegT/DnrJ/EryC1/StrS family aminotransferase [Mariprofundales bacterium]